MGYTIYSDGKLASDIYYEGLEAGADPCYEVRHAAGLNETSFAAALAGEPPAPRSRTVPQGDRICSLAALLTTLTLAAAFIRQGLVAADRGSTRLL